MNMIERHINDMKHELYNRINSSSWKSINKFFMCNNTYTTQPEYDKICNEVYSITDGFVPRTLKRVRVHYDFLVMFSGGNISVDRYYTVCLGCHNTFKKPKNSSRICTSCVSKNIKVCDRHNYVHGFINKYSECLACNIEASHTKHVGSKGVDYVECSICSLRARELTSHYTNIHNITPDNDKYIAICHDKRIEKRGEKNPAYKHGGKYSPYSHYFIKYKNLSTDEKYKEIQKIVSTSNETKIKHNSNNTRLEFYLNKGYTKDEAHEHLSNRQATMRRYYNISPETEHGNGIFYILKLEKNDKFYIKIGISRNTLNERYSSQDLNNAEIINIHHSTFPKCVQLERLVMEKFQCIDRIDRFDKFGWTEVFEYSDTIIDFISQHIDTFIFSW